MKFEEIVVALREGKHVEKQCPDGRWITISGDNERSIVIHNLLNDEFRIVEKPRPKVKKYQVLYVAATELRETHATDDYFRSKEDFKKCFPNILFIQLIEDSEKEFEE